MKGSARAGSVIAAPVNAEQRILKVCASVADKNNCAVIYFFKALCTCHPEQQAGNAAPKVYESEAKFSYLFIIMGY